MIAKKVNRRLMFAALGSQAIVIWIVAFVPIGFDHPASTGLDYSHFLMLFALYCVALVVGVAIAIRHSQWLVLGIQAIAALAFISQIFPGPWNLPRQDHVPPSESVSPLP